MQYAKLLLYMMHTRVASMHSMLAGLSCNLSTIDRLQRPLSLQNSCNIAGLRIQALIPCLTYLILRPECVRMRRFATVRMGPVEL